MLSSRLQISVTVGTRSSVSSNSGRTPWSARRIGQLRNIALRARRSDLRWRGNPKGDTSKSCSARSRKGVRLVASTVKRGHATSRSATRCRRSGRAQSYRGPGVSRDPAARRQAVEHGGTGIVKTYGSTDGASDEIGNELPRAERSRSRHRSSLRRCPRPEGQTRLTDSARANKRKKADSLGLQEVGRGGFVLFSADQWCGLRRQWRCAERFLRPRASLRRRNRRK